MVILFPGWEMPETVFSGRNKDSQDLAKGGAGIEIMEENGFTSQKLFNRTFKEIYGCTPSAVRKGQTGQDRSG